MLAPPLKGFGPPSNVPFCLKMSDNHAESSKIQKFPGGGPPDPPKGNTSPLFLFSLKSLFVVGPSTEKSLKKALSLIRRSFHKGQYSGHYYSYNLHKRSPYINNITFPYLLTVQNAFGSLNLLPTPLSLRPKPQM